MGERISAIVDITTKDGNKRNFEGKVGVSPFMAKVVLEGPLKKIEDTGGSSSFVLSAKHSYLDESSKVFYEYVDSAGLPFTFTDLYGKLSLYGENGSKVSFFGFNHQDDVNFLDNAGLDWNSFGAGTHFVLIPGQNKTVISGNFSFSDYKINLTEEQLNLNENPNSNKRFSNINGFNLGADFTNYVTDGEIKYGFDIVGFKTDFIFFNSIGSQIRQKQNTTELGAYAKYRKKVGRIVLEPSLRVVNYGSLGTTQLEPRMGFKANISDNLRFKAAGGLYSQNLISSKSDRDVVNLFTGFLSGPETTLPTPDGGRTEANIQKATHVIAGFEIDLTNQLELNVEGYLKDFTQLINISRDKLFPDDPDYVIEEGQAYGADVWLKFENRQTFIWAVYSLGFNDRFDGTRNYNPHFDRRHNVNLVFSRSLGPESEWEASARWNFGSGLPFTRTQGFYQLINFDGGIDTDYVTENGELGILFEEDLNKGQLSHYHRFDIALKRTFNFVNKTKLDATVSVTNLYDRENIFYVDRITNERVYQLPILPSIGLSYSFH